MKVYLRVFLVALIVQASSSALVAASNKGWVEAGCSEATFHLTEKKASSGGQQLVLVLSINHRAYRELTKTA